MLKALSSTMTALLLLSSCSTVLHDFRVCSPYPDSPFEELGASCDNFLTKAPASLTKTQWRAQIAAWAKQGYALECTNSLAIAQNKAELEKLCSVSKCSVEQKQEVAKLWGNLDRMERMGKQAGAIAAEMSAQAPDAHGLSVTDQAAPSSSSPQP